METLLGGPRLPVVEPGDRRAGRPPSELRTLHDQYRVELADGIHLEAMHTHTATADLEDLLALGLGGDHEFAWVPAV